MAAPEAERPQLTRADPDVSAATSSRGLTAREKRARWWAETKVDLKWATALLFFLILAVSGFLWDGWSKPPASEENLASVTTTIFSTEGQVVPFEILSILLLAALVAAVAIAFRDPEGGAR